MPHHTEWPRRTRIRGFADVAQLVERDPSKVDVAGSMPVIRSTARGAHCRSFPSIALDEQRPSGVTGSRAALKPRFSHRECGFDSRGGHALPRGVTGSTGGFGSPGSGSNPGEAASPRTVHAPIARWSNWQDT